MELRNWTNDDLKNITVLKKKALANMQFAHAADLRSLEQSVIKALKNDWVNVAIDKALKGGEQETRI